MEHFFDAVSDGTIISKSKPDPEVFIKAAAMLGLDSQECLVVEDASAGVVAAVKGGIDCAGLGDAAENDQALYKMDHFSELLEIVLEERDTFRQKMCPD